jgi:hypothetical protein
MIAKACEFCGEILTRQVPSAGIEHDASRPLGHCRLKLRRFFRHAVGRAAGLALGDFDDFEGRKADAAADGIGAFHIAVEQFPLGPGLQASDGRD